MLYRLPKTTLSSLMMTLNLYKIAYLIKILHSPKIFHTKTGL